MLNEIRLVCQSQAMVRSRHCLRLAADGPCCSNETVLGLSCSGTGMFFATCFLQAEDTENNEPYKRLGDS